MILSHVPPLQVIANLAVAQKVFGDNVEEKFKAKGKGEF